MSLQILLFVTLGLASLTVLVVETTSDDTNWLWVPLAIVTFLVPIAYCGAFVAHQNNTHTAHVYTAAQTPEDDTECDIDKRALFVDVGALRGKRVVSYQPETWWGNRLLECRKGAYIFLDLEVQRQFEAEREQEVGKAATDEAEWKRFQRETQEQSSKDN